MARRAEREAGPRPIDSALDAMDADQLRALVRDFLSSLHGQVHARLLDEIMDRASRGVSRWAPDTPARKTVTTAVSLAEAARRVGCADPADVDDHLLEGVSAFLARDYGGALAIFRALLVPIGEGEIDLGQDEMVEEVLGTDVEACAARFVVATYMTAAPGDRARAVRAAIDEVCGVGRFREPLRETERVAVEPLPGIEEFLPRWRALLEAEAVAPRRSAWGSAQDGWLREVVQRMDGARGLGRLARSTRRASDLRDWCEALVEAGHWEAALAAYEEAAEIVTDRALCRGEFLDGAALAAQELGREDLPARLERAWREAPTMLRLRRWLGTAGDGSVLRQWAARALEVCPDEAHCQRAFLYSVLGEHETAARLLAAAPGLGWSGSEHPGHLVFPLLAELLGAAPEPPPPRLLGLDPDDLACPEPDDRPRLATPEVAEILRVAGNQGITDAGVRKAVLGAMRKAAEKRLAGVTESKRRRHYGHAAHLVAVCQAIDPDPAWVAALRFQYRRFPALQREFARHLGLP